MNYLVAEISEESIDILWPVLMSSDISFHRFTYRVVERRGRQRIRTIVERPVCPGLLFVAEDDSSEFEGYANAHERWFRWMKNTASESGLARCTSSELEPIFRWIDHQNRTASMRESKPKTGPIPIRVGQEVDIIRGPFVDFTATVMEVTREWIGVELHGGLLTIKIAPCNLTLRGVR